MKNIFNTLVILLSFIPGHTQYTLGAYADSTSNPLTSEECIKIALEMNHHQAVSKYTVEIAEAQHRQVLASYFPQLTLSTAFTLLDQDPNFIFPPSQMIVPPINLGGVPLEFPPIDVPKQEIKLMDKQNLQTNIYFNYPLFTGGRISSLKKQSSSAIDLANQEAKRNEMQVIYDVKRYYYAAVLARKLFEIGQEALARLEVTLELTENLYQQGSGRVKKTDYLKNKIVVETIRSLVAAIKYNEKIATAALANTMGLRWQHQIELAEQEIPYQPYNIDTNQLISALYQFNPDWQKINLALKITELRIDEAKSGYFPKIAIIGKLEHIENSYQYGMATAESKDSWMVGVGVQFPIFSGFRIKNQVKEARTYLNQLKEQRILLQQGLAGQVQHLLLQMASIQEQCQAVKQSLIAAQENRSLTERAYQQELLTERDLIEAQIIESLLKAQYLKVIYDHFEVQAHLDFLIGREVSKLMK